MASAATTDSLNAASPLESLPPELFGEILSYLWPAEMMLPQCSRRWREPIFDPLYWKPLFFAVIDLPFDNSPEFTSLESIRWHFGDIVVKEAAAVGTWRGTFRDLLRARRRNRRLEAGTCAMGIRIGSPVESYIQPPRALARESHFE